METKYKHTCHNCGWIWFSQWETELCIDCLSEITGDLKKITYGNFLVSAIQKAIKQLKTVDGVGLDDIVRDLEIAIDRDQEKYDEV
jgi:hypothetical protein